VLATFKGAEEHIPTFAQRYFESLDVSLVTPFEIQLFLHSRAIDLGSCNGDTKEKL